MDKKEGTNAEWKDGFAPFINSDSKILILGSFPSVKSREVGFYYGNPQNRFWKTVALAVNDRVPVSTEEKKDFLVKHRIALWDVLEKSSIDGSSDVNLTFKTSKPADLKEVIESAEGLELIICNGKKAFEIFNDVYSDCPVRSVCLSSTSPANPRFDRTAWILTIKSVLGLNLTE